MWRFNELRSSAAPMFFVSKILGLAPISNAAYYHNEQPKNTIFNFLHGAILIVAYCLHFGLGMDSIFNSSAELRSRFTQLFGLLVTYAGDILLFFNIISAYIHKDRWISMMRQFCNIDDTMSRLGFNISYRNIGIRLTLYLSTLFLGSTISTLYNFFYGRFPMSVWQLVYAFSFVLPMYANSIMKLWYLFYVTLIHTKVHKMNERLIEICDSTKENHQKEVLDEVDRLVDLHEKLCEMSVHIDKIYSLEILLSIGHAFVMVTSQLYFGYLSFAWKDRTYALPTEDLVTPTLWAAYMLIDIVSISSACSKAKLAAKRSSVIMHKIANHIDTEQVYTKVSCKIKCLSYHRFRSFYDKNSIYCQIYNLCFILSYYIERML